MIGLKRHLLQFAPPPPPFPVDYITITFDVIPTDFDVNDINAWNTYLRGKGSEVYFDQLRWRGNSVDLAGMLGDVTWLVLSNMRITGLEIDKLQSLVVLVVDQNLIETSDFSALSSLETFSALIGRYKELPLLPGTIKQVDVSNNRLVGVCDISPYPVMESFTAARNEITALTIGDENNLQFINLFINKVSDPNTFVKCTSVVTLRILSNQFSSLNIENCAALQSLNASNNQLTAIDIGFNLLLWDFNLSNNQLVDFMFGPQTFRKETISANLSRNIMGKSLLRKIINQIYTGPTARYTVNLLENESLAGDPETINKVLEINATRPEFNLLVNTAE